MAKWNVPLKLKTVYLVAMYLDKDEEENDTTNPFNPVVFPYSTLELAREAGKLMSMFTGVSHILISSVDLDVDVSETLKEIQEKEESTDNVSSIE